MFNSKFKEKVDEYCKKLKISVREALEHDYIKRLHKRWRKSMDKKVKMEMFEKLERLENRKQKIMEQAIWHDGEMDLFSEEMCNALDSQIIDIEIQLEENGIVYPYVWVMNNIMPILYYITALILAL